MTAVTAQSVGELKSAMESARDHGERCCEDLVKVHVGHVRDVIAALERLQFMDLHCTCCEHTKKLRDEMLSRVPSMKVSP